MPVLSVSIHDGVSDRELDENELERKVTRSDDRAKYKAVAPGDLTYNMMRAWQGGFGTVTVYGMVSPAYVVARPMRDFLTSHIEMLLRTPMAISEIRRYSRGITDFRLRLYWEDFKGLQIALPPLAEQLAIASFLGRETDKIDSLIAEQEMLLALLAEKRQATISHVVTRGLNPNVTMKDSGVAWLGEVPAHWEVTRLKFVASVQTGIAKGKDTTGKATITVPYLRVANVQDGFLALDDIAMIDIEPEQLERYRLLPGDVLMNEGGDFDKLGRGAIWYGEIHDCIHQNHVFAVRPHGVDARWLNQITSSQYAQFYFMGRSKQSTNLASISSSNIMELPVLIPPPEEQGTILTFIDAETAKLDNLKAAAIHTIELLKERRSALIAAAVTGKIDVREAVPEELAA
ncbi:restriction endonuclease subunit S [Cupriavidus basilensis]|nr:restriction endonuclease subunit S [Cupriavidus basilensis]